MDDLLALLVRHGVAVVFAVTLAARLGAPVPAVPFLIVAGALSVDGQISLAGAIAAALAGNLIGDAAWFLAGRRWGYRVMRLLCRISLSADACVARSESFIGRWGGASLIAAKFVPGVSVVAPPMAGALHMSNTRFLVFETIAALIWTLLFLMLGRLFHTAIGDVLSVLANIGLAAVALVAVALMTLLVWRYAMRYAARRSGDVERIDVAELRLALRAGGSAMPIVVDVRGAHARDLANSVGPLSALISPGDGRELIVYCDCPHDASAIVGARRLMAAGLPRVRVLAGGLDAWEAAEKEAAVLLGDTPEPAVA
jgi:membrane protein DedA with SNARE-associated domain/rhodanese-related sulfurtransferase